MLFPLQNPGNGPQLADTLHLVRLKGLATVEEVLHVQIRNVAAFCQDSFSTDKLEAENEAYVQISIQS